MACFLFPSLCFLLPTFFSSLLCSYVLLFAFLLYTDTLYPYCLPSLSPLLPRFPTPFVPLLPTSSTQGSERLLTHYQFLAWPDYGVPSSGSAVLNLIQTMREMHSKLVKGGISDSRIIVHCSAGVGRSGALCVINNCIDEYREKGAVNVQAAVRVLRLQRAFAIQTDEQYAFCYRTVLQYTKSHPR